MKLSVIIPVYNECATIGAIINAVQQVSLPGITKELIVVDDGSDDGTREWLQKHANDEMLVVYHEKNIGKGAAVRTGFKHMTGEFLIVQDADMEYDPCDWKEMMKQMLSGADAVYGSRFNGSKPRSIFSFCHRLVNRSLTIFSNIFSGLSITDVATCYKMVRRKVMDKIILCEDGFAFDVELAAKLGRLNCKVTEANISYYGRPYSEGKKFGWRGRIRATYCVVKYSKLLGRILKT
jgi:glycosyltransferase involved in cell wall biosynthesis